MDSAEPTGCPYAGFRRIREAGGVAEMRPGMFTVARYEDVRATLLDAKTYSAVMPGDQTPFATFGPSPVQAEIDEAMRDFPEKPVLMRTDPPDHTRVRNLVSRALTPAEVEKIEPAIQVLVDGLAAPWIGTGQVEFVSAFAARLPGAVTTRFLGAPPEMQAQFKFWAGEVMSRFDGPQTPERQLEVARNINDMGRYFLGEIAKRRASPTGDLVCLLAHAEIDGDRLEDVAIVNVIQTFLIGGHETTTFLLGESLHRLAQNPALAARLREDPSLVPSFVEEMLRIHSPAQSVMRATTRDVELGGTTVPAGSVLVVSLASANRDETVFEAPDEVRVERSRTPGARHVAFGYGVHTCIGLNLARAEARIALQTLLPRMADIALASDHPIERLENFMLRGPLRLDLEFTPA